MGRKVYEIKIKGTVEDVFIGYCDDSATRTPSSVKHDAETKSPESKVNQALRAASEEDILIVDHMAGLSVEDAISEKKRLINARQGEGITVLNTKGADDEL